MARRANFSPKAIDSLKSGSIVDPQTPGLRIEVHASGKKSWKFIRRIAGSGQVAKATLGFFPAHSIAAAREWARDLNEKVECGIDPREERRAAQLRAGMTVARAHALYMEAVREGRASRAKRKNKPRTIKEKLKIYSGDIAPKLASKSIYDVAEKDLVALVIAKGKSARIRANRLAAELNVFFGWAASLRGTEVGLADNPARRLGDLRFPESPRQRKLSLDEIGWYLKAVAEEEERDFRRGLVLLLLTAARISELCMAATAEVEAGVWTIPEERSKNSHAHVIALGPWGKVLMANNAEWVFPAPKAEGPRTQGWYEARDRVLARMSGYAGHALEHFVPHDLRRTARSNTKRLDTDFETAEAMLNHLRTGMARIYDGYELEEEKAAWFLKWEHEIARLARKAGVADRLEVPTAPAGRVRAIRSTSGPSSRCARAPTTQ